MIVSALERFIYRGVGSSPVKMVIDEAKMPAPDAIVRCKDGTEIAAMFYYAVEGQRLDHIARDHGFEVQSLAMQDDIDEDDPLHRRLENMEAGLEMDWHPTAPDGWRLALKNDTEDGPVAIFIRPIAA